MDIEFSPDGNLIASAESLGRLILWKIQSPSPLIIGYFNERQSINDLCSELGNMPGNTNGEISAKLQCCADITSKGVTYQDLVRQRYEKCGSFPDLKSE